MTRKSIAEHAVDVLLDMRVKHNENFTTVAWGDADTLHEIANRTKLKTKHPLDVWQSVLNGLYRRPDLWEKLFYKAHVGHGRELMVRCFKLIE